MGQEGPVRHVDAGRGFGAREYVTRSENPVFDGRARGSAWLGANLGEAGRARKSRSSSRNCSRIARAPRLAAFARRAFHGQAGKRDFPHQPRGGSKPRGGVGPMRSIRCAFAPISMSTAFKPWREFDWIGGEIKIGGVVSRRSTNGRCGATNVNPVNGRRDLDIPGSLRAAFGHKTSGFISSVRDGGEVCGRRCRGSARCRHVGATRCVPAVCQWRCSGASFAAAAISSTGKRRGCRRKASPRERRSRKSRANGNARIAAPTRPTFGRMWSRLRRGRPQRCNSAIRLEVSQRLPPIPAPAIELVDQRRDRQCAPLRRASSRQMPRSLRIQSTAKPKSNLPATMVL